MNRIPIDAAEVVLPCARLEETLAFFERLGFRTETVFPADDPTTLVISGHGLRIRLERDAGGDPGALRILSPDPAAVAAGSSNLTAPNGTRIEIVDADSPPVIPPARPSFTLTRAAGAAWHTGRAGMMYRDLIPGRQGGRFIASHIRLIAGGPVADYVHFHKIRFQMIYCCKGWVRVVYEDQGPPFVARAGDCILQPPRIRHRVLESAPGAEVLEIACPAEHETLADHGLALPTTPLRPDRGFDGQRFVHHEAEGSAWHPWRLEGFLFRDTGVETATGGLAAVHIVRPGGAGSTTFFRHDAELFFAFVLAGAARLGREDGARLDLGAGDAAVLPPRRSHELAKASDDLEVLIVTLPGRLALRPQDPSPPRGAP